MTTPRAWRWVAAPLLAPVVVFWEAVAGRRLVAPGDGHTYYLPLQVLVAEQWRSGVFPGWDRGTFAGSPLFAQHQAAALHPATLLRLALPPVVGHNLTVVAALAVAGVGAHVLARRITDDDAAAAVAGCAFALCGFQFAHLGHVAILSTAAWLPWMLWAADRLVEKATTGRLVAGAVVVALASLSGHGQLLAYSLAATLVYAVVVAGRSCLVALWRVGVMAAVGGTLAAVQLVPVVAALGDSDRSTLTHAEATAFSHDPAGLLVLIAPFLYGNARSDGPVPSLYAGDWTLTELGGYVGAAALILALAGLPALRRDRRLLALVVVGVGSTLVALGDSTPVSHLVHALPGFGQMRSWARYTLGAQLAVAVLAAVGVARARSGASTLRPSWLAAASVMTAGAVAVLPAIDTPRVDGTELLWAVGAPCLAALLATAGLVALRRHPAVVLVMVVLVAVDPVVGFGWWFRWRTASPTPAGAADLVEGNTEPPWGTVPDAPGGIDRYLWAGDPLAAFPHTPRVASAGGSLSVTGMDPLAPADYLEVTGTDYFGNLREQSHLLGPRSHVQDLLRVTVVARDGPGREVQRSPRSPALPEAFLVGRTRRVGRAEAVAAAIGDTSLDPGREAVFEGTCEQCPSDGARGRAGVAGPVQWRPAGARLDVFADRPAMLVLSQAWSPGWSATVDGDPAPVLRADGVVQGVPVPAGQSTVVVRYRVPGLDLGLGVTGITIVGMVAVLVIDRRRHRQLENHSRESRAGGASSIPVQIG